MDTVAATPPASPTDHPDYPRRLAQRRDWLCLDGAWSFAIDATGAATHPRQIPAWDREIRVPFAPESAASGIGDPGFHADVWYRRGFALEAAAGHRVVLHLGAVDYAARVWVDDVLVGAHVGGHSSFSFDVTDALAPGREHTVTVWAHDDPHDLAQPRGKQDWHAEPHSIWYPRTTGIWQTVWLEQLPARHVRGLRFTPDLGRWAVRCDLAVTGDPAGLEVRVRLRVGERMLADDRYALVDAELHREIALPDPGIDDARAELLWTPETPTLIHAEVELLADGAVVDEVRSYTALRGVRVDRGRVLLNERPYRLRLVLDQGYWPDTLLTPPSEEAIVRDIQAVKAAGFNGVRKHQKIEDPRFLYWADVLGLVVWEELPSPYRFTPGSIAALTREWLEVVERDAGHPCILVWVVFNESWGVPDLPTVAPHRHAVQALYHLTHALDPTRPVVGNDGWEHSATDLLGIHDYEGDPARLHARYADPDAVGRALAGFRPGGRVLTLDGHPHAGQPLLLTEFGGIALRDAGDGTWGYSVARDGAELERRYTALLDAVHRIEAFAGFCYTQFTDTFQEANGLFTADREPKFDLAAMRAATVGRPAGPPPEG